MTLETFLTTNHDIDFDFKANKNNPNANWPTSDDIAEYPGAGDVRGPHFMGFFAGITIECNDALNGNTLRMSEYFMINKDVSQQLNLIHNIYYLDKVLVILGCITRCDVIASKQQLQLQLQQLQNHQESPQVNT